MIERFNLWEYSGLDHPGTIEATKSVHHGFGDAVKHIGKVELDIKEIKWCSNGLPLFPLKIFGDWKDYAQVNLDHLNERFIW